MKQVVVDEHLLDEARNIVDEPSDDAIVNRALSELIRVAALKRGIQTLRDTRDVFWPNYLEELRPNSDAAYEARRAVYEGREPKR
jgi:hypothetical protein